MNNLNSLQGTLADLKEIVQRNQGADHEASRVVFQIEQIVADIERKARNNSANLDIFLPSGSHAVQTVPVV